MLCDNSSYVKLFHNKRTEGLKWMLITGNVKSETLSGKQAVTVLLVG
jgi:hypothetical protein